MEKVAEEARSQNEKIAKLVIENIKQESARFRFVQPMVN